MQEIQFTFDAAGGRVDLTRITAVYGDRVGALPRPERRGYVFDGWYLASAGDPHAADAVRVGESTVVDAALFGGNPVGKATLVARWSRPDRKETKAANRRRSSLATQRRAVAVLLVLAVLLGAGLIFVNYLVDIYHYEDVDGTRYTIKKSSGVYGLYLDGKKCDVNNDGYYLTTYGTQLSVDRETGEYNIFAVVDTAGTEVVGTNQRVLMFKQLTYDASSTSDRSRIIKRFEIDSEHGKMILSRTENNRFEVEGHEGIALDDQLFAQLSSGCGYTLSLDRLQNPVRTDDGSIDYAEYGLAPEVREKLDENGKAVLDEDGNPVTYEYTPAHYTITTMSGETYSVTVGDLSVSGAAYYARYDGRDTVYMLSSVNLGVALSPVETLITPMIIYPMSLSTYFYVKNFEYRSDIDYDGILRDIVLKLTGFDLDTVTPDADSEYTDEALAKIKEAQALMKEMDEKQFTSMYSEFFNANSRPVIAFSYIDMADRENTLCESLPYQTSTSYMEGYLPNSNNIGTVLQDLYDMTFTGTVKLGPSDDDLAAYGLSEAAHIITFIFTDPQNDYQEFNNEIQISKKTEDGIYYAYSPYFDMIVSFSESEAPYLEWEEIDWYEREYFQFNIAHIREITLEGSAVDAIRSSPIRFTLDNSASDQTEGVNSEKLEVYVDGEKLDYDIIITKPTGSTSKEKAVYNFRRFTQALLTASMEGVAELTEEEMAALRESSDDECLLKLTVNLADYKGTTQNLVFRFYRYTERHAYMTVEVLDTPDSPSSPENAQGRFYVLQSFCNKLVADANRVLIGEEVTSSSKS